MRAETFTIGTNKKKAPRRLAGRLSAGLRESKIPYDLFSITLAPAPLLVVMSMVRGEDAGAELEK